MSTTTKDAVTPTWDESRELDELAEWRQRVGDLVRQISDDYEDLYGEDANRPHYRTLSEQMLVRFRDRAFARAAFLHGVLEEDVEGHLVDEVDEEILAIIRGTEQLLSLRGDDPDVTEQLQRNVLPHLEDVRSAYLFVFEKLDHLDPTGVIERWTRLFHDMPHPIPVRDTVAPRYRTRLPEENYIDFVRAILAPACRYLGYWHFRNTAEDAALLYSDRDRFEQVVAFAIEHGQRMSEMDRRVQTIRAAIETLRPAKVRWEWHHAGSLHLRLPPRIEDASERHLSSCGWVTVETHDEPSRYRMLAELHERFGCVGTAFRGLRSHRYERAAYRAIHTKLLLESGSANEAGSVNVRLFSKEVASTRFAPFPYADRQPTERRRAAQKTGKIHTYAPDGRLVVLPEGACVLEFAIAIHDDFVCRCRGARVNRREVGIFHRLRQGDVVMLHVGNEPRPLPPAWEGLLSGKTRRRLRRAFRINYRPVLAQRGRNWLKSKLAERGVASIPDGESFDEYVQPFVAPIKQRGIIPTDDLDWLFTQIGLVTAELGGERLPYTLELDELHRRTILEVVHAEWKRHTMVFFLDIPEDVRSSSEIRLCPSCDPTPDVAIVGTRERGTIVIHRRRAACAGKATYTSRVRPAAPPRYILTRVNNRVGIAADVLGAFKALQVGIQDLVGSSLGEGTGVLRQQIAATHEEGLRDVLRVLRGVPGVIEAVPLTHREHPLEAFLPPRRGVRDRPWLRPEPFRCGPPVSGPYFYGREKELAKLHNAFEAATTGEEEGEAVFVRGPKKVGKSSLVLEFLEHLHRTFPRTCLTARYEAKERDSWGDVRIELTMRLRKKVHDAARDRKEEPPSLKEACLEEVIQAASNELECNVVLAIDEAVGMFANSEDPQEEAALREFTHYVKNTNGLMVIWCGLEGPLRGLRPTARNLLQSARPLSLFGLDAEFNTRTVRSLLQAEKLGQRYVIRVEESVARHVQRWTGGNPHWVMRTMKQIWEMVDQDESGITRMDHEVVQHSLERVATDTMVFGDRLDLFPAGSPRRKLAYHVLERLALQARRRRAGLEVEEIWAGVLEIDASPSPTFTMNDLALVLAEMGEYGSIVWGPARDTYVWRIAAPLLAEYFLNSVNYETAG